MTTTRALPPPSFSSTVENGKQRSNDTLLGLTARAILAAGGERIDLVEHDDAWSLCTRLIEDHTQFRFCFAVIWPRELRPSDLHQQM